MTNDEGKKLDPRKAYARALYRAAGFTDEDLQKPLIAVVNSWSEYTPGHIHLRQLAEHVKAGIRTAGGMPAEFNTIAACDGIAQGEGMHYILPTREIIAASVELMVKAHQSREALVDVLDVTNRLDAKVVSLEILEPNLETVFLEMTGRNLRD